MSPSKSACPHAPVLPGSSKIRLFFFILTCLTSISHNAQSLKFQHYNQLHGLKDNRVYALFMDHQRKLWVGTSRGISLFDGEHFYNPSWAQDSIWMQSKGITGISADRLNNLWISATDGLWRVDHQSDQCEQVYTGDIQEDWTTSILWTNEYRTGWFLTPTRLCKITANTGQIECFPIKSPNSIFYALNPMICDQNGVLWFTSGYQLWSFDTIKSQAQLYLARENDPDEIWSLYQTPAHEVWIGTRSEGLYCLDENKVLTYAGASGQFIRCLHGTDAMLWAGGGKDGLITIIPESGHISWNVPDTYNYGWANCFLSDTIQNIRWIGTQEGILKVDEKKEALTTVALPIKADGYPPYLLNFIEDQNHTDILWIKIIDQGIGSWNRSNHAFEIYQPTTSFGKSNHTLLQDQHGKLWTTTYTEPQIKTFHPSTKIWQQPALDEKWRQSNTLFQDQEANLWIGTAEGDVGYLVDESGEIIEIPGIRTSIRDSIVSGIFNIDQSSNGDIWILTDHQLFRTDKSGTVDEIAIPPPNESRPHEFLTLFSNHSAYVWIGTRYGLWQLDQDGQVVNIFQSIGPDPITYVYKIQEDPQGIIWLGTNNGLYRIDPDQAHIRKISINDGLQSNQAFFISVQPSGNLYIGYPAAFQSLDTRTYGIDTFIPPLQIMDFKIMDKSIPLIPGNTINIRPAENYFTIYYAALNFRQSELNKYKYRLAGFENKWHEVEGNNIASYSNIPAGNYDFELQGSNNDGLWSPSKKMVSIRILAPFYKQAWFRLLLLLVGAGLAAFYIYLRKEEQKKIKKLRLQIARDLHDEVGSSLSSIGFLTEFVRSQHKNTSFDSDPIMQKIGQTTGHISDAMAGIIWTLQEEQPQCSHIIQRLDSFGKRLAHAQGLEFEVIVDPAIDNLQVPSAILKDIYLIGKEGLHNAAKYAGKCKMTIEFRNWQDRLKLIIADNGLGCDLEKVRKGNGLRNIKERVQAIGGRCEFSSQEGVGFSINIYF